MRVVHFSHRYPPAVGGSEAYFARLSAFLAARGDSVSVWTTNALDLEAFWDRHARRLAPGTEMRDAVEVRRFPLWHFPFAHRYVMKLLSLAPLAPWKALTLPFNPISPAMYRAAGSCHQSFDLVHATAFPYSFPLVCAARLARHLRIPFLLTPFVHTGDPDDPTDRIRLAYTTPALLAIARMADRLFVQTEGEGRELMRHGIPPERLVLQGLGVDPEGCLGGDRASTRTRWKVADEDVVIGHLGNNSIEKGGVDLLQAAQMAWQSGQRWTLVLAGPQMPNFLAFWKRFQPAGCVHLLGQLRDAEKRDFFAAIDIFALPSRSDSFGLVLPEAWANGVPCVGYRAGGVSWVIRDGVDGRLVRCGDVVALADALSRLSADPESRRRMGKAGLARVPTEFNWQRSLSLVRAAYEEVIAQRKGQGTIRLRAE